MSYINYFLFRKLRAFTILGLFAFIIDGFYGGQALLDMLMPQASAQALPHGRWGYVIARGLELQNGKPIWAEIGEDGKVVGDIGVASGRLEDAVTMDAAIYRSYGQLLGNFKAQNPALTQGAYILTYQQYQGQDFGSVEVPRSNVRPGEPQTETIAIPRPSLEDSTKSVFVRAKETIIDPRLLPETGPVLLQFPVDMSSGSYKVLANDKKSVLLDNAGKIIKTSEHNIGFKSGFFRSDESGFFRTQQNHRWDFSDWRPEGDPLRPIVGAKVHSGSYTYRHGVTNEDGMFGLLVYAPSCFLGSGVYGYTFDTVASFSTQLFHPEAPNFAEVAWASVLDRINCNFSPSLNRTSVLGRTSVVTGLQTVFGTSTGQPDLGYILVDALVFSGFGRLSNDAQSQVPISANTEYNYSAPAFTPKQTPHLDLNADRRDDFVVLQGDTQSVYFDAVGTNGQGQPVDAEGNVVEAADLQRLADIEPDFEDQGLLKTLSEEDLKKTDIYLYRVSNGLLITKQTHLNDFDVLRNNGDHYVYRIAIPGPRFSAFGSLGDMDRHLNTQPWANLAEDLLPRESDYLRPGEQVKIIAINRPTGYTGSVIARAYPPENGLLDIPTDKIIMRPPNLKIWAERIYTPVTRENRPKEYTIGFEGSALTTDTQIMIHTEWFEHDGTALPEGLEGYTGRMAKVTGPNSLSGGDVATFSIKPGSQLQVVKFEGDILGSEHFYVHVSGFPEWESPGIGAASQGPLQYRPKNYVPIKVPIFDEETTRQFRNFNAYNRQDGNDYLDEVAPVYQWPYRPEMQFSVFDLKFDSGSAGIFTVIEDDSGGDPQRMNIYDEATPVIGNDLDIVEVIFSLLSNDNDPLEPLGPERELILALGEDEMEVTFGRNKQVQFSNLEHLSSLDVEDFLTMRFYANNDAENILWEWAFEYLYIEPLIIGYENQTDDVYYVTADDPVIELKTTIAGYAYRDPETRQPVQIRWLADGDGSFDQITQIDGRIGVFDNTLTMQPVKGAVADVSVELVNGDAEVRWKNVEVLAGEPHHISIVQSGQAVALEQSDLRLDVYVYDQHNNLVEDGTEVNFSVADNFIVKDQELETTNGRASIILTGGEYTVDESIVTIESGIVSMQETVSIQGLNVDLVADSVTLRKQQIVNVTATVTKPDGTPANDVPISFSASRGLFAEQEVLTNAAGVASTQFTGGLNELTDTWVAQAGFVGIASLDYTVQNPGSSINAQDAMLVADEMTAGDITFDEFDITSTIGYETEGTIEVRSDIPTTVKIGDLADPNLEPLVSLSMNQLDFIDGETSFQDAHELNPANASEEIRIVYDHPLGAGRSAKFETSSRVTFDDATDFVLTQDIGFRLDIKPNENGTILEHGDGAQVLSYGGNTLTYTILTDVGSYSVQAPNVDSGQWHQVATRMANNLLELYVDGQVYSTPVSGSLVYNGNQLQIGGLEAVMRSFRLYDWSSQPLVTFADGSTEKAINPGAETLTLKSLGNLGNLKADSQLSSLCVAVISGDQRNYASLLTKKGYQEIAQQYLRTVSPQSPYTFYSVPNPFNGIIPVAYAWSWDGIWEGAKSTISFLIPYEDFIVIGEQLVYLMNQEWENFDATKLAFASLGAATVIPLAKPLKPLLGPLKKVVDGMAGRPAAKHFAGGIGSAVKSALGGKTDKLVNLLPFILIAIELYEDPEVFTFLMNAIESEDDLWVWVEVIADTVILEGGLDELSLNYQSTDELLIAENPLSWLVASASASRLSKRQVIGRKIKDRVKKYSSKFPGEEAKKITKKWKILEREELKVLRDLALKSGSVSRYLAVIGVHKILSFARNSKNWRVNRWFVLFSIAYLSEEHNEGRLSIENKAFFSIIAAVFSNKKNEYNGKLFQLSQVMFYHAMNQLDEEENPKVLGIEQVRGAYEVIGDWCIKKPYKRQIDIIIEASDGGEEWVETKSLSKSSFSNSKFKNVLSDKSYYRQFFHDLRLNKSFITNDSLKQDCIIPSDEDMKSNEQYTWYFHKWSSSTSRPERGIPPTPSEESKAQEWFCKKPNISNIKRYYEENLAKSPGATKSACKRTISRRVTLRDTTSYLTEIMVRLNNEKNLGAEDFIDVINTITDPNWK